METSLANLEVFWSELSPNRAVVQAHLAGGGAVKGLSLRGIVRGPRCSRGSTLPATYRLVGQASGLPGRVESLPHATAIITEPIFWSPDWPALYDVTVELRRDDRTIDQATRTIGLRPLAVGGKFLSYAAKTWILRGIWRQQVQPGEIAEFRAASAAVVANAESLDEPLLQLASEEGVLIIAQLGGQSPGAQLARLARGAAVAVGVLPPEFEHSGIPAAGNILLAHRLVQGRAEPPPDAARLVLAEVSDPATFATWAQSLSRAVVAFRPLPQSAEVVSSRAECDRLQRDLAPYGQFAGYIV